MRSWSASAAALALSFALGGCGVLGSDAEDSPATASPAPSATETREGRLLTADEAEGVLPSVHEIGGTGWTTDPGRPRTTTGSGRPSAYVSGTSADPPVCLPLLDPEVDRNRRLAAVESEVSFSKTTATGTRTTVTFIVESWRNAADTVRPSEADVLAGQCGSFTGRDSSGTFQVTAAQMRPLPLGREQCAFRLTLTVKGVPVHVTTFEAKIDRNVITMIHVGTEFEDPLETYWPTLERLRGRLAA
ncbi:hypothetical protein [Cryptosporangium aurantiacum]|uniref:Lipoprotein n=1 Tax=Cryptosporangium aurantiacum TaxID=134849 RepID=A0A1M7QM89_9ACTN|nr:hypothetical protein [Cryptosporangium aurantiacum]SHN32364.1 hypothetical protein SAMN05443668_10527 [Cryptosporangium aurantiacum]